MAQYRLETALGHVTPFKPCVPIEDAPCRHYPMMAVTSHAPKIKMREHKRLTIEKLKEYR